MTSLPLVSIIIPAYNSGDYIGEALDSLIAQTYRNWEAIIIMAPSTDDTYQEIRKRFRPNIHVIQEKTKTNCATGRNTGYAASRGKYVYFNDADDWLEPTCLELMVGELEAHPSLSWVVSYQMTHWDDRTYIIDVCPGTHCNIGGIGGTLFRKECLENVRVTSGQLFNERLNHTDDGDLVLRTRRYPHKMIPVVLSNYRWNHGGLTANTHWLKQQWGLSRTLIHRGAWDLLPGNTANFCIILINETFGIDLVKIKKGLFR